MKMRDFIDDGYCVFQCTKCFNRFNHSKVVITPDEDLVCPIDGKPLKQLLGNAAKDARAEIG